MNKSIHKNCLAAALALGACIVPAAAPMAQSGGSTPHTIPYPSGSVTPWQLRRPFLPVMPAANTGAPVTMSPFRGPIGTNIMVQVNRNLGAMPAILSFKAVVSRGVPARVHSRLLGSGASYRTPAPIQLCIQGGGTWEAELVLSNGRNLGTIGSFTPTNCPR